MISIHSLYKSFGQNKVLNALDVTIQEGGIFAILGPNGSGKTTLIKSILGMVIPDSGEISINDVSVRESWKYRQKINYMPQIAQFPGNLRVNELIRMIKDLRQKPAVEAPLINKFNLEPFLDKKLSTLSGGTKQKVNILLAFMFDSPLLILDEPTTGLDPASLIILKEMIHRERQAGKTILVTSHIMQFVEEIADEIIYLLEGKIYFKGSIAELKLKTSQDNFEHAIAAISMNKEESWVKY
ncbi:ABC transporter ATP-binding protein [Membranicola marinus]|uniref:ABC transporter ATP-binding protein n=1 Tax=Membranihabitans marinus TaxID=1227546 RepID=A0A953LBM5_9BACT|nr:ABC transporter ATP-binding protein [Membranihabitans marinus]MBY5959923.1 ABC transporter ATP-binding protein [Membranihabitans marinus]